MELNLKFLILLFGLFLYLDTITLARGQQFRNSVGRYRSPVNRSPYTNSIRSGRINQPTSYNSRSQVLPYKRSSPAYNVPQRGQFNRGPGGIRRPASVSIAKTNANSQNIGIGQFIDLNSDRTNTKTVSKTNGGLRNGGSTSIAKSNAQTNGINLGGLGISNTVTRSKTNNNGQVSRGVANNFNVGGLDIGSSVSRDNLKNIGLHRNSDGSVGLGLGLLDFDIGRKANPVTSGNANAAAAATATGQKTRVNANSNANSQNLGLFDYNTAQSNSKAVGISRRGQSTAAANGQTNTQSQPQPSFPILGRFLGRRKRDLRIQQYTDDCCFSCPSCNHFPTGGSEALINPVQFPNFNSFSPGGFSNFNNLPNFGIGNGVLGGGLGLGNSVLGAGLGLGNGVLGAGVGLGNGVLGAGVGLGNSVFGAGLGLGNALIGNGVLGNNFFGNGLLNNGLQTGSGILGNSVIGNPFTSSNDQSLDKSSSFLTIGPNYQSYSNSVTYGSFLNALLGTVYILKPFKFNTDVIDYSLAEYIIQEFSGRDKIVSRNSKSFQPLFVRKMKNLPVEMIDSLYEKSNKTKEEQNILNVTPQPRTFGFIFDLFTSAPNTIRPIVVPVPIPYPQPIPYRPNIGCCGRPRPNLPPPYVRPYPPRDCCYGGNSPCSGCRYAPPRYPVGNSIYPFGDLSNSGYNPYNYGNIGSNVGGGFGIGNNPGLNFGANLGPLGIGANLPGIGLGGNGLLGYPTNVYSNVPLSASSSFGSVSGVTAGSTSTNTGSFLSAILAILG